MPETTRYTLRMKFISKAASELTYLYIDKLHREVSLPIVPQSQVNSLPQHFDRRLGAVCLRLGHADVIDEHYAVAADWWTIHACEDIKQVEILREM